MLACPGVRIMNAVESSVPSEVQMIWIAEGAKGELQAHTFRLLGFYSKV